MSLQDAKASLEHQFGALILDLGLPDGDGLDLVRELRSAGRGVPILILTRATRRSSAWPAWRRRATTTSSSRSTSPS